MESTTSTGSTQPLRHLPGGLKQNCHLPQVRAQDPGAAKKGLSVLQQLFAPGWKKETMTELKKNVKAGMALWWTMWCSHWCWRNQLLEMLRLKKKRSFPRKIVVYQSEESVIEDIQAGQLPDDYYWTVRWRL
jgi:hypothetical protein